MIFKEPSLKVWAVFWIDGEFKYPLEKYLSYHNACKKADEYEKKYGFKCLIEIRE